nr:MAG TPA: hypothetical protein [Caudoviricetes sp.]
MDKSVIVKAFYLLLPQLTLLSVALSNFGISAIIGGGSAYILALV